MTIPVSTVPAAVAAILAALTTQLSTASETGVVVVVGTPGPDLADTLISVASAVRRSIDPAAFVGSGGARSLVEKYTVDVLVSVALATATTQTGPLSAVDRAWQLVAYVEAAVRTDPSLGTIVDIAYPAKTSGSKAVVGNGATPSRVVTITVSIHCENLN